MKQIFLIICMVFALFIAGGNLNAQEIDNGEKLNLSVDVASGFVWRGMANNMSPVVQPAVSFTAGIFSVGAWASVPFMLGEHQEIDIFASLQIAPALSIVVTDYYVYDHFALLWNSSSSYFNYKKENEDRSIDFQLIYEGSENFPLKAMASTIIGGYDLNEKGKRNFSTYLELGYGSTTKSGVDWEIFTGFVPMKSENYYGIDGPNIINIGVGVNKNFEITPAYSLPLSLKISVNPAAETIFLVASIALF